MTQVHRQFRKPLIIMSPKNLLRHPKVGCTTIISLALCCRAPPQPGMHAGGRGKLRRSQPRAHAGCSQRPMIKYQNSASRNWMSLTTCRRPMHRGCALILRTHTKPRTVYQIHTQCKSDLDEFDDVPGDHGIVGVRFKRLIMDDQGE